MDELNDDYSLEDEDAYNADNKKKVNEERAKEGRRRKEELAYVKEIMSTKKGRTWICGIIALGDPFVTPYGSGNTPEQTHVNIGRQQIPAKLMLDIREIAPEEYVAMLVEAKEG